MHPAGLIQSHNTAKRVWIITHWLRQRKDPEVLNFLNAEMGYLEESMKHTMPLQETLFSEMKARIQETDSTVPEERGGYLYYQRTEAGRQYPIFCRRRNAAGSPEEVLLDQNALAEGRIFCSVGALAVSPDGSKLAYSVDYGGDETYTVHIRDLENNKEYPETIPNAYGSVYFHTGLEWANDNETIFYGTLDEAKRPFQLFRHKIGTDPSQDVLIYHEQDETFFLFFHKTRDDLYIITDHSSSLTSEVHYLPADTPEAELRVISPRRQGIEYSVNHHKGSFFILTNENAKNFKLVKTAC